MVVQVILELEYRDWTEVTIHTSARLLEHGSPSCYSGTSHLRRNADQDEDPFTTFGSDLLSELHELGLEPMYSVYGFMVRIPVVFGMNDTIWQIFSAFKKVAERSPIHDGIAFGVTNGDNVYQRPELTENPSREQLDEMIGRVVATLDITPVRKRRYEETEHPAHLVSRD